MEGWDRFWDDDNRLGTEDEDDLTGCGDDLDGDGTPNWRDWDTILAMMRIAMVTE